MPTTLLGIEPQNTMSQRLFMYRHLFVGFAEIYASPNPGWTSTHSWVPSAHQHFAIAKLDYHLVSPGQHHHDKTQKAYNEVSVLQCQVRGGGERCIYTRILVIVYDSAFPLHLDINRTVGSSSSCRWFSLGCQYQVWSSTNKLWESLFSKPQKIGCNKWLSIQRGCCSHKNCRD